MNNLTYLFGNLSNSNDEWLKRNVDSSGQEIKGFSNNPVLNFSTNSETIKEFRKIQLKDFGQIDLENPDAFSNIALVAIDNNFVTYLDKMLMLTLFPGLKNKIEEASMTGEALDLGLSEKFRAYLADLVYRRHVNVLKEDFDDFTAILDSFGIDKNQLVEEGKNPEEKTKEKSEINISENLNNEPSNFNLVDTLNKMNKTFPQKTHKAEKTQLYSNYVSENQNQVAFNHYVRMSPDSRDELFPGNIKVKKVTMATNKAIPKNLVDDAGKFNQKDIIQSRQLPENRQIKETSFVGRESSKNQTVETGKLQRKDTIQSGQTLENHQIKETLLAQKEEIPKTQDVNPKNTIQSGQFPENSQIKETSSAQPKEVPKKQARFAPNLVQTENSLKNQADHPRKLIRPLTPPGQCDNHILGKNQGNQKVFEPVEIEEAICEIETAPMIIDGSGQIIKKEQFENFDYLQNEEIPKIDVTKNNEKLNVQSNSEQFPKTWLEKNRKILNIQSFAEQNENRDLHLQTIGKIGTAQEKMIGDNTDIAKNEGAQTSKKDEKIAKKAEKAVENFPKLHSIDFVKNPFESKSEIYDKASKFRKNDNIPENQVRKEHKEITVQKMVDDAEKKDLLVKKMKRHAKNAKSRQMETRKNTLVKKFETETRTKIPGQNAKVEFGSERKEKIQVQIQNLSPENISNNGDTKNKKLEKVDRKRKIQPENITEPERKVKSTMINKNISPRELEIFRKFTLKELLDKSYGKKCVMCGKYFKDGLKRHLRTHLERGKTFTCKICGKTSVSSDALESHIRKHHKKSKT